MARARDHTDAPEAADAVAQAPTASPLAPGLTPQAALARAVRAGIPLSNRGVGRALARDYSDEYGIVDPWADTKTAEPAAPAATSLGQTFRAEIVTWLEKFAKAPSKEGAGTGFDELLGDHAKIEETRKKNPNYTTCNDTTIQIFTKSAVATNLKAGKKINEIKTTNKDIGIVRRANDFKAKGNAAEMGAWVDAGGGTPEKGDILLFVNAKEGSTLPEHIGFFYEIRDSKSTIEKDFKGKEIAQPEGTKVWVTIDGGQGKKGTWIDPKYEEVDDPKKPGKKIKKLVDSGYVKDSGSEIISKRERYYWPDTHLIEGEPNQLNKAKRLLGWVKVDKLVQDPA